MLWKLLYHIPSIYNCCIIGNMALTKQANAVLFLPFSLHTYVCLCVCFVWEERFFILGLSFMDNKDPISKYSRVLSLGSWLNVPGNSPLKTRRISSADTPCRKSWVSTQAVWQALAFIFIYSALTPSVGPWSCYQNPLSKNAGNDLSAFSYCLTFWCQTGRETTPSYVSIQYD